MLYFPILFWACNLEKEFGILIQEKMSKKRYLQKYKALPSKQTSIDSRIALLHDVSISSMRVI
jgi:hypothetical protein